MVLHALGRQRVKVIKSGRGFGKVGVALEVEKWAWLWKSGRINPQTYRIPGITRTRISGGI